MEFIINLLTTQRSKMIVEMREQTKKMLTKNFSVFQCFFLVVVKESLAVEVALKTHLKKRAALRNFKKSRPLP